MTTMPPPATAPTPRLPRAGFFWAAGIFVIGCGTAIAWFVTGLMGTLDAVDGYARTQIPGTVEFTVAEAGTYRVFLENEAQDANVNVLVVPRDGSGPVELDDGGGTLTYDFGGYSGVSVAQFDVEPGEYAATVAGDLSSGGTVAFGESFGQDLAATIALPMVLGGVSFVVAVILLVVTLVRRSSAKSRLRAAALSQPGPYQQNPYPPGPYQNGPYQQGPYPPGPSAQGPYQQHPGERPPPSP